MKKILFLLAAVLLMGCEYTTPLVTTPNISIDKSLLGCWQIKEDDGKTNQMVVLPLDDKEYLVSYPSTTKNGMFFKACLCKTDGKTLVQLKLLGVADGNIPDDDRVYKFARYSISGDKLTVSFLNTDVVNRDATSSKELAKLIADNRDNPKLFEEPGLFVKVSK